MEGVRCRRKTGNRLLRLPLPTPCSDKSSGLPLATPSFFTELHIVIIGKSRILVHISAGRIRPQQIIPMNLIQLR